MNNILKIAATLFAGTVIAMSFQTDVKAEPVYFVNNEQVYVTDTNNLFYSVKLPSGTAIPANSLVMVVKSDDTLEAKKCLLQFEGFNPCNQLVTFRTTATTRIEYTADNNIALNLSYGFGGVPGDAYLNNWKAQQEARAAQAYGEYLASFVPKHESTPCWNDWTPCWDACVPCWNDWTPCWDACAPCWNDWTPCWDAYAPCWNDWTPCWDAYAPCCGW